MTNNVQTDIFSMFGLIDEKEEQRKLEEAERKKKIEEERKMKMEEIRQKANEANAKKAEKTDQKKTESEKFDVNEETVIRYYGESFEITSYFTPEEIAEGLLVKKKNGETERKPLEPEMLRKRMEKDFPELVKDHTEMVFLKAKNIIVPTMKAKKKGNCMEASSTDDAFPFPKIPFSILKDFISVARLYGEIRLEVHADIYYHFKEGKFLLDFPKQTVHSYWAEVIEDSQNIAEKFVDAAKILEIHSHHLMPSVPSEQDNQSERIPGMYYAIVGRINEFFPQLYLRKFISEEKGHLKMPFEHLFEYPFLKLPKDFDTNAIEVSL